MNSVNGWYLHTSDEHYRCHEIYVKHIRSTRISDTVHFKHKHITTPTLTPEDTIVKAMTNLTEALRERLNTKGAIDYKALQKLDELMNKIPIPQTTRTQSTTTRQVTFDPTVKPAAETQQTPRVHIDMPTPRVQETMPPPRVQEGMPTLRVQPTSPTITAATIDNPLQWIASGPQRGSRLQHRQNYGVRSVTQGI